MIRVGDTVQIVDDPKYAIFAGARTVIVKISAQGSRTIYHYKTKGGNVDSAYREDIKRVSYQDTLF